MVGVEPPRSGRRLRIPGLLQPVRSTGRVIWSRDICWWGRGPPGPRRGSCPDPVRLPEILMSKTPTISFVSLGCSKNLVDSERMLGLLAQDGYAIVPDSQPADLVVV